MAITVDVRDLDLGAVSVHGSPLVETMATLHMVTERDHHYDQRMLIERIRRLLTPDLAGRIEKFAPLWSRYRCRLFFPLGQSSGAWADELAAIERLDRASFVSMAAEGILGLGRRGDHRDLLREPAKLVAACKLRSQDRAALAQSLMASPPKFKADLLDFLEEVWGCFAEQIWHESLGPIDAARKRTLIDLQRNPTQAIADLSETAQILAVGRVAFDKLDVAAVHVGQTPLHLIPSRMHSPHLTIKSGEGMPTSIVFPVGRSRDDLAVHAMQRRLEALASPFRMRLLRHLLAEPHTTGELALRTGVDAPQVSRALTQLRQAGIVTTDRVDGTLLHQADAELIRRLGLDVVRTIMR